MELERDRKMARWRYVEVYLSVDLNIFPRNSNLAITMLLSQMRRGLAVLLLLACRRIESFQPSTFQRTLWALGDDTVMLATRRDFVEKAAFSSIAAVAASFTLSPGAEASGGATAGGVYLLSVRVIRNHGNRALVVFVPDPCFLFLVSLRLIFEPLLLSQHR
jgi:hypothetical protein